MVREIYDTELDDLLKLYLNLHEDTVPEIQAGAWVYEIYAL